MSLGCLEVTNAQHNECFWTQFVSEESTPLELPPGYFIAGGHCRGRYCDDMELYACRP